MSTKPGEGSPERKMNEKEHKEMKPKDDQLHCYLPNTLFDRFQDPNWRDESLQSLFCSNEIKVKIAGEDKLNHELIKVIDDLLSSSEESVEIFDSQSLFQKSMKVNSETVNVIILQQWFSQQKNFSRLNLRINRNSQIEYESESANMIILIDANRQSILIINKKSCRTGSINFENFYVSKDNNLIPFTDENALSYKKLRNALEKSINCVIFGQGEGSS